ncbi:hypothetical protein FRC02_009532 [Tulasnella sp. 418]|nr:hypothetical protein FRC02_009532 [Tulasnella sp. 418]
MSSDLPPPPAAPTDLDSISSSMRRSDSSLSPSPQSSELMTPADSGSCDDASLKQKHHDEIKSENILPKKSIILTATSPRSSPSVRVSFLPFKGGVKDLHRSHSTGSARGGRHDDGTDGDAFQNNRHVEDDLSSVIENDGDEESDGAPNAPRQKRKASRVGKWNVETREKNVQEGRKTRGRRRSRSPSSEHATVVDSPIELESPLDGPHASAFGPPSAWSKTSQRSGPYQNSINSVGSAPSPASSILSFRNFVHGVGKRKGSWSSWSSSASQTDGGWSSLFGGQGLNVLSDIPTTHKLLESATVRRLGNVSEKVVFVCEGGVEPGILLQTVRRDVMKACVASGGDRLIQETWSYTVKPKKNVYKVTVSYNAMSAKDTSPDAPSDPQKPVCLNMAINVPGLMTIKERS